MARTLIIGNAAEGIAQDYLTDQGLITLDKNYRCKTGEIDLIMSDNSTLVFIEVRYRKNDHFGGAAASVDRRKQNKLIKTAQRYLQTSRWQGQCRFDVVALNSKKQCEWIKNAF